MDAAQKGVTAVLGAGVVVIARALHPATRALFAEVSLRARTAVITGETQRRIPIKDTPLKRVAAVRSARVHVITKHRHAATYPAIASVSCCAGIVVIAWTLLRFVEASDCGLAGVIRTRVIIHAAHSTPLTAPLQAYVIEGAGVLVVARRTVIEGRCEAVSAARLAACHEAWAIRRVIADNDALWVDHTDALNAMQGAVAEVGVLLERAICISGALAGVITRYAVSSDASVTYRARVLVIAGHIYDHI